MEFTKDQLVIVASELNTICDFNEPIETAFEPTAKGAAAKSQEKKFVRELGEELVKVLSDAKLVEPGDMPKFTDEARAVIKEMASEQVGRLFPGEEETLDGKGRTIKKKGGAKRKKMSTEPKVRKYTRIDAIIDAIKLIGLEESIKNIAEKADSLFVESGNGESNQKVSANYSAYAVRIIKEAKGKGIL